MDVNNAYFHLIKGPADWSRCRLEEQPAEAANWLQASLTGAAEADWLTAAWDDESQTVTLKPLLPLLPRPQGTTPLPLAARRDAAVDQYGNWYWISQDRRRIFWQPAGGARASLYWEQKPSDASPPPGDFAPQAETLPPAELCGLAVSSRHYLVVGNLSQPGLFLFDLHAGGPPLPLRFPDETPFAPFAMAAGADGCVWILDRANRRYWGLDGAFRIIGEPASLDESPPADPTEFRPLDGAPALRPARDFPQGFPLPAHDPAGIVALPDGSVLILDRPAAGAAAPTRLHHFRLSRPQPGSPIPLPDLSAIAEKSEQRPVIGYDMAYFAPQQTVTIVDQSGVQAIAFKLRFQENKLRLRPQPNYLPLPAFGGRALAAGEKSLYYDAVSGQGNSDEAVRWLPLQAIDRPRYERTARLRAWILDGKRDNCVWHRIFVDACIPPETSVVIWTRAHNDPDLLASVPFQREPDLYLRGGGAEIPHYDPFAGKEKLPAGTGVWELLCQQARGRYLEVQIEMAGNGRVTPELDALRIYYPRFSYPRNYLPAVYLEEPESASFLERLLANMEGTFSEIEAQITHAAAFFDPRCAPPEALDWLAGWLGLLLDPLWGRLQRQRRQLDAPGLRQPAADRRRLFIRYGRLLFRQRGTVNGIRFALHLLLEPCLEEMLQAIKQASVQPDHPWRQRLAAFGLPPPSPSAGETALEDILHAYILQRPSRIRIVERFLTRDGRALVAGDIGAEGLTTNEDTIQATAHRFSVLIPERLTPDEEAMVQRIIALEKPAHTQFDIGYYWAGFRIGQARLGLDTTVDQSPRFTRMSVGRHYLAQGYLPPAHPMDQPERLILSRDRLGRLPSL